jgi:hypothetical protein
MAKKNQSAFVQMPSSTVAALKAMLFNSAEGVDLSGIINDIAGDHLNKDLVSINVALAFHGHKPELDNTVRIVESWEWGGTITTGQMTNISLITSTVEVARTEHKYNVETKQWDAKEAGFGTMNLKEWYDTNESEGNEMWTTIAARQEEKQAK